MLHAPVTLSTIEQESLIADRRHCHICGHYKQAKFGAYIAARSKLGQKKLQYILKSYPVFPFGPEKRDLF